MPCSSQGTEERRAAGCRPALGSAPTRGSWRHDRAARRSSAPTAARARTGAESLQLRRSRGPSCGGPWRVASPASRHLRGCGGVGRADAPGEAPHGLPRVRGQPRGYAGALPPVGRGRLGPAAPGHQPREIHIATDARRNGRRAAGVRVHLLRLAAGEVVWHDGVLVTSLARTVVDLAATADLHAAISAIDHVLHIDRFGRPRTGLTRDELWTAYEQAMPLPGFARAKSRIAFGAAGARPRRIDEPGVDGPDRDAPASTAARLSLRVRGVRRRLPSRRADAIGEVDGKQKYLDAASRGGRTAEQVVYDEKIREDELRARSRAFGRWPMAVGMRSDLLRPRLIALGVRTGLRGARPR